MIYKYTNNIWKLELYQIAISIYNVLVAIYRWHKNAPRCDGSCKYSRRLMQVLAKAHASRCIFSPI